MAPPRPQPLSPRLPGTRPSRARLSSQRLTRLAQNRWLRTGLLVVVVVLAVWGLASQWTQVRQALGKLDGWNMAWAELCVLAGLGAMMMAWRALLADLGSALPLPAAVRVLFLGQLGKYVPGAVWALAAQVELARDYDIPRRRSATASLLGMATTLVAGLVVAGITLPLISKSAVHRYWWVLAITPLAIACLHPKVVKFLLNLVLRLVRQEPLEKAVSLRGMGRALAWTFFGWGCYGVHAWLLTTQFAHGGTARIVALSFGAYALAWSVGFLIIFFPSGIGPREAALIAVLSPVMPAASALVVALASRIVMTIGDLLWAGAALTIGRGRARRPEPEPHQSRP